MKTQIIQFIRTIVLASLAITANLVFVAPLSFAQSFRGSITDAHSLPIPSSKITARNLGTTQTPDVAQGNPGLGGGGPRVMQFGLRLHF